MNQRITSLRMAGLVLAALMAFGCGKKSDSEPVDSTVDGERLIRITGNDQMRFNLAEIRVEAGETFRLMFTNVGRMPKETMGHNWILFTKMSEGELNVLAMDAAQNPPDYLPQDRSGILARTRLLGPGEHDVITVMAPSEPGEYVYACTFPGHFALMRGKLIVE